MSWRALVERDALSRLKPRETETLDALYSKVDIPEKEPCDNEKSQLAGWLTKGVCEGALNVGDFNELRLALHLKSEVQAIRRSCEMKIERETEHEQDGFIIVG